MHDGDTDPNLLPAFINLEAGFCDPALTRPNQLAVFRLADGTRVEFAVRDAVALYACEGPRVESHQLVVARPFRHGRASVALVQLRELFDLNGMPEVLRALEHHEAGRLKDAARYAAAAGPRWRGLVDYFGGPA